MPEKRNHVWELIPDIDSYHCALCGMVASLTAVASGVGVRTKHGWILGEGSVYLPDCVDPDLDEELARLLADNDA